MSAVIKDRACSLADYTQPCLVRLGWRVRDAVEAVEGLGRALVEAQCVPEFLSLYHAVINREFLLSTAFAPGMAMPHARMPNVTRLWFALGCLAEPIPWLSRNGPRVSMVFLSASPLNDSTEYLGYRSAVGRLVRAPGTLAALQRTSEVPLALEVLAEIPTLRDASRARALQTALEGDGPGLLVGPRGGRSYGPGLG